MSEDLTVYPTQSFTTDIAGKIARSLVVEGECFTSVSTLVESSALVEVFRSQNNYIIRPNGKTQIASITTHCLWVKPRCKAQLETHHAEWAGKGCHVGQSCSPIKQERLQAIC